MNNSILTIQNDPLITIVTPVYNHSIYLDEFIKSVLEQQYNNIELILIDDFSKDGSVQVIDKWKSVLEQKLSNFIFIKNKINKGVSYNCNLGLKQSNGEYICFFSSDDVMLHNRLSESVRLMENNNNFSMVYSGAHMLINGKIKKYKHKKHPSGYIFKELLLRGNFIIAPTVTIRKKVFDQIELFNTKLVAEDYDMWLKISSKYKVGFINKALCIYRLNVNSLSNTLEYKLAVRPQYNEIKKKIMIKEKLEMSFINKVNINFLYSSLKSYFYYYLIDEFNVLYIEWKKIQNKSILLNVKVNIYYCISKFKIIHKVIIFIALYIKYGNKKMYYNIFKKGKVN